MSTKLIVDIPFLNVIDYKTGRPKSRNEIEGNTKNSNGDYKRQLVFYNLLLNNFNPVSSLISFLQFVFLFPLFQFFLLIYYFLVNEFFSFLFNFFHSFLALFNYYISISVEFFPVNAR